MTNKFSTDNVRGVRDKYEVCNDDNNNNKHHDTNNRNNNDNKNYRLSSPQKCKPQRSEYFHELKNQVPVLNHLHNHLQHIVNIIFVILNSN